MWGVCVMGAGCVTRAHPYCPHLHPPTNPPTPPPSPPGRLPHHSTPPLPPVVSLPQDFINDETIELMAPYLELEGFTPSVARNASRAAEGLCTWCRAMSDYHEASKIVKPKVRPTWAQAPV